MKNRTEIKEAISAREAQIEALQSEIAQLTIEDYQLCDDTQRYEEKEETWDIGKKKETHIVGRIYWVENFKDESNPDVPFQIERSRMVRKDGEWYY